MEDTQVLVVPTPVGPGGLHVEGDLRGKVLVLGHGTGGGPDTPDLLAARDGALAAGWAVVRVVQPWRVAGRRVAEAPARLDAAFVALVGALGRTGPLVVGGRSSGARVGCRTARGLGAQGVLALAFPLVTARGASRQAELDAAGVPVLVVQGGRDAFGRPAPGPGREVHVVAGADHAFAVRRRDGRTPDEVAAEVADAVGGWLRR